VLEHGVNDLTLPSLGEPQNGAIGDFEDVGPLHEVPKGQVTATGWRPVDVMSFDEWAKEGRRLRAVHNGVLWAVGDWLNFGEAEWGERYTQAVEATGYAQSFLQNVKWVAAKFPAPERRGALSFSHHSEVASLEPETAKAFLTVAEHDGMTTADLRKQVKEAKAAQKRAERPDKPKLSKAEMAVDDLDRRCRAVREVIVDPACSSRELVAAIWEREDKDHLVRTIRETADDLNVLLGFLK
jgi:hypothetical protein